MATACLHCKRPFNVTEAEVKFLEHISPVFNGKKELIKSPTHCPLCRVQRRMAWRNDRTFYRRKCDLTGEEFISMFAADTKFPVYKQDAWHSDKWSALDYGQEIDWNRPFFEQWSELRDKVPHWGVAISNCENSDYCNYCTDEKNCYLDIAAEGNEDCYFDLFVKNSTNCVDCTFAYNSELLYECIQCYNSYNCRNSQYLDDCSDCAFCYDCKGCKNCLLSINLRNQEYYILNEPHSKEEYEAKLKELNLGSSKALKEVFKIWHKMRLEKGLYRDMYNLNCENSTGNNLKNCKNCYQCFNATNCEDGTYLYDVLDAKDCADINYSLYNPEACYEVISTVGLTYSAFYMAGPYNSHCFYSQMLQSCKNCFGCVGLKQQQYCIFNKQYTKEEYNQLVPKLIAHMRETAEWGEFFPVTLSPHGYNETVAQEYLPLTKKFTDQYGWSWRAEAKVEPELSGKPSPVPDNIADCDASVCDQIYKCEESRMPYKIINQEFKFYKQQGVPIPRRCPAQRHLDRNALRNPRLVWQLKCAECNKSITTSYQADRPERVLCEACYLEKVY